MITLSRTTDAYLIASLNEEVQNLHARLHPELFKPHNAIEMEKSLSVFFADPNCYCYLATKENEPIGYVLFFIREIFENTFHYGRKSLYIDQICVLEKHHKTGAGKILLQQADTLAKELSIGYIQLDHWSSNTVAAKFFRKHGYSVFREHLGKSIS